MRIFKVECGVLLDREHEDFEAFSNVYDKKNAYFDEIIFIENTLEKAKYYAEQYVEDGVNGTYAIISYFEIGEEYNDYTLEEIEDNYIDILGADCYDEKFVVKSYWKVRNKDNPYPKTNGVILVNFMGKDIVKEIQNNER